MVTQSSSPSNVAASAVAAIEIKKGRWEGRNRDKDQVRAAVWERLLERGVNVGPVWSVIPNFVGADTAAYHLAQTDAWKQAQTVKCNPDAAQIPVRLRALYEGKIVYAPVPYLTQDFPYLRLDPQELSAKGISFELAATSQGFVQHGQRIGFDGVVEGHLDFCVVGSVAVSRQGGRTGKGAGFADLETGIFRELGIIDDTSVLATTVHSCMLVDNDEMHIVMDKHDSPLDFIATEQGLIVTNNTMPRPQGVTWENVRDDQFDSIPFLRALRDDMLQRKRTEKAVYQY